MVRAVVKAPSRNVDAALGAGLKKSYRGKGPLAGSYVIGGVEAGGGLESVPEANESIAWTGLSPWKRYRALHSHPDDSRP